VTRTPLQRIGTLTREVAVIVVGVSVALGADAAYQGWQEGRERVRILESLHANLLLDADQFERGAASSARAQEATTALVAYMEGDDELDPTAVARLVRTSVIFPSGVKESTTFREITATGRIALINDDQLREALLGYYARTFTGILPAMWANYVSNVSGAYERSLQRILGAGYLPLFACNPSGTGYDACLFDASAGLDLEALRNDAELRAQVVGMANWARRFSNLIRTQGLRHQELLEQITGATGEM
jgi:hypothetical protein